jgi:hypothetical protein
VITAVGVWFIGSALPDFGLWANGILPTRQLCIETLVALVTIVVASLAGGSIYKEA